MQDRIESLRKVMLGRHFVGNACIPDFRFRTYDTLRERRWAGQEGTRNFFCCQSTHLAQGERNLRLGRQCRVAAGENQAQLVVMNGGIGKLVGILAVGFKVFDSCCLRRIKPCRPMGKGERQETTSPRTRSLARFSETCLHHHFILS